MENMVIPTKAAADPTPTTKTRMTRIRKLAPVLPTMVEPKLTPSQSTILATNLLVAIPSTVTDLIAKIRTGRLMITQATMTKEGETVTVTMTVEPKTNQPSKMTKVINRLPSLPL